MRHKRFVWHSPNVPNKSLYNAAMMINNTFKCIHLGVRLVDGKEMATLEKFCAEHKLTLKHEEDILPGITITVTISGNNRDFQGWVYILKLLIRGIVGDTEHEYLPPKQVRIKKGTPILLNTYVADDKPVKAVYIKPGEMHQFMDGYTERYHYVQIGDHEPTQVQYSGFSVIKQ